MAKTKSFGLSHIYASRTLYDFTCNICKKEGKNNEALFRCIECQIFYCQSCVTGHNKFTENHTVFGKESRLFGQPSTSNELPADLCEEHHGEVIKMFCGKHDLVCCTVCIAVNHRSCYGVGYIPNIAKGLLKRQEKDETQKSLEKVKDDLRNLKSKIQNELNELSKQHYGILDEIQKFKKSIMEIVEQLEKRSIEEVQYKYQEIADNLTSSSKKIDDMLKVVELRLDKLKRAQPGYEAQIFVDIKYGQKQASDGNDCVKQAAIETRLKVLEFEANRIVETCLHELQSLGKLNVWV